MNPAAVLEIDLGAIADNWRTLDAMHAGATAGVIKADAYGLGAAQVAPALYGAGCRHFFTAHLSEAVAVRNFIPGAMLAVLHGILPGEEDEFAAHDIAPVLGSLAEITLWRDAARRLGCALPALLHVDTGMARLGLSVPELAMLRNDTSLLDGISIEYLMTHLVSAETPSDPLNQAQRARFIAAAAQFPGVKTSFANSSGNFLAADFASDLGAAGGGTLRAEPGAGTAEPDAAGHPADRPDFAGA